VTAMPTYQEKFLNGIPWELCCMTAVALRLKKPFHELGDDLKREMRSWIAQGFIPHDKGDLLCYLKAGSWPLSNCNRCGQPQCREFPSYLWHLLRPGKLFSLTTKGFGLSYLCTWCMKGFSPGDHEVGIVSPQEPIKVLMPPVPAPSSSQINRRQLPTLVVQ
jgi:hypothetical protein